MPTLIVTICIAYISMLFLSYVITLSMSVYVQGQHWKHVLAVSCVIIICGVRCTKAMYVQDYILYWINQPSKSLLHVGLKNAVLYINVFILFFRCMLVRDMCYVATSLFVLSQVIIMQLCDTHISHKTNNYSVLMASAP